MRILRIRYTKRGAHEDEFILQLIMWYQAKAFQDLLSSYKTNGQCLSQSLTVIVALHRSSLCSE